MIDITGLNKAEILAGLYNASHPRGMGILHHTPENMTTEEADEILKETTDFDYLKGRVMKVHLSGNEFDEWLYDRDNGSGAAQRVIDKCLENIKLK